MEAASVCSIRRFFVVDLAVYGTVCFFPVSLVCLS